MESSTYPDKKVIEASQNYVNVVAHNGTKHGTQEILYGREKKTVCATYGSLDCDITCAEHEAFNSAGIPSREKVKGVPAIIILAPDGQKELHFDSGGLSGSQLVKLFKDTLADNKLTPLPGNLYHAASQKRAEGEAALAESKYKEALKAYKALGSMKGSKLFKEWSDAGLEKVNAAGNTLLEEAQGKIDSGEKEEAKKSLKQIQTDFSGLECAKKAAELLKTIKE